MKEETVRKKNHDRAMRIKAMRETGTIKKNCHCLGGIEGTWAVDVTTAQPIKSPEHRFAKRYWCVVCGKQAEVLRDGKKYTGDKYYLYNEEEYQ